MSLIKCGTDENGSYIELKRPRGETPLCFIDECGVVHDTIRIYEYKAVRSKEIPTDKQMRNVRRDNTRGLYGVR